MTTGRFLDTNGQPLPAPLERPLLPDLPRPPIVDIGGVECVLVRVRIDDLPAWAQRNGLRRWRSAFMGRLGWVSVYWPEEKG